jgi:hypothetical protein
MFFVGEDGPPVSRFGFPGECGAAEREGRCMLGCLAPFGETFMSPNTFVAVCLFVLCAFAPANAQPPALGSETNELMTYFYKDPRPERLVGFLAKYDAAAPRWDAFPPAVGFYAFVFRTHPEWIERLLPDQLSPRTAATVAAALRLSGNKVTAPVLLSRLNGVTSDHTLLVELTGLPARLEDLRISTPTHLDILWGASFASGDPSFVRPILQYFAETANGSPAMAVDVLKIAIAIAGGPKEVLGELRGRYGDALARQAIYAATALWALESNARQHPFVERAVTQYVGDNPGTPAARVLSTLHPKASTP